MSDLAASLSIAFPSKQDCVLAALYPWVRNHPACTFLEFCDAYRRAQEVAHVA